MKTSTYRDGTLKNQPNKMGMTPQHIHTIPYILCYFANYALCLLHRRVVEGSVVGIGGFVVHVDVHGECVTLWLDME